MNKKFWLAIIFVGLLAFLPDPTDVLDGGTPIIEFATVVLLAYFGGKKK